jgi:hypothetical protein
MQIDFHHAVTYVAVRLAGLSAVDAGKVAHAAQYVDDSTHDGPIKFKTGERYVRATSAHKTMDFVQNVDENDNRLVWLPFHFLPGNEAPPAGVKDKEAFMYRLMCKPNSQIAQEMMHHCVKHSDLPFSLHRLGVALHTYVDTWAHQQFVGTLCDLNSVKSLKALSDPVYAKSQTYKDLTSFKEQMAQYLANHLPLGHAGAVTMPDLPFLTWRFVRDNGEVVERNNPVDFMKAVHAAFNMTRRYIAGDVNLPDADLPAADAALIDHMLRTTLAIEGEDRHPVWLQAIADGKFSFGAEQVSYVDHGEGSWKMLAVGQDPEDETDVEYDYQDSFLTSDWKYFHDAVHFHRQYVIHELLPKFGLCAA